MESGDPLCGTRIRRWFGSREKESEFRDTASTFYPSGKPVFEPAEDRKERLC
jgi:hypothetical protein